jgi:hypothetical protein
MPSSSWVESRGALIFLQGKLFAHNGRLGRVVSAASEDTAHPFALILCFLRLFAAICL